MTLGVGVTLITSKCWWISYALRLDLRAINNKAVYEAMIGSLKLAKEIEITEIRIYSNSQLVVNQVTREF